MDAFASSLLRLVISYWQSYLQWFWHEDYRLLMQISMILPCGCCSTCTFTSLVLYLHDYKHSLTFSGSDFQYILNLRSFALFSSFYVSVSWFVLLFNCTLTVTSFLLGETNSIIISVCQSVFWIICFPLAGRNTRTTILKHGKSFKSTFRWSGCSWGFQAIWSNVVWC